MGPFLHPVQAARAASGEESVNRGENNDDLTKKPAGIMPAGLEMSAL